MYILQPVEVVHSYQLHTAAKILGTSIIIFFWGNIIKKQKLTGCPLGQEKNFVAFWAFLGTPLSASKTSS